jgi:hypothetical protein
VSTPARKSPRTPAAKGRRVRVHTQRPNPYAVMVYRLSLAVLLTIVVLHLGGN